MPVIRYRVVGAEEYAQEQRILAFEKRVQRHSEWVNDPFGYIARTTTFLAESGLFEVPT